MKKTILITIFISISYFAIAQKNIIPSIQWLIGSWEMKLGNKGKIIEKWKLTNDSCVDGVSYFIKPNGDSIQQETIKLIYNRGNIFYIPTVNDQNNELPVSFKMTSFKHNTLVFENPNHDFPQKITYSSKSANKVNASIEGISKGKFKKIKYPMQRINY
jgi:hypothetical protein